MLRADKSSSKWPELPEKINLLVNAFTYDRRVGGDVFAWCCSVAGQLMGHKRFADGTEEPGGQHGRVEISYSFGYPTDRIRNHVSQKAKADGYNFLLMLDDDMRPDLELFTNPKNTKPFLTSTLDFMFTHDGPCVVGAPYCGGPPEQRVMVMKNRAYAPDQADGYGVKLDSFTRDEAAVQEGIKRVSALPTGCLMIDLRILDIMEPPWFSYEYGDPPFNTVLASTEDIVFTRNGDWMGIPQYCNWDSWAGHHKTYLTGRPRLSPIDSIPRSIHDAIFKRGWRPNGTFDGEVFETRPTLTNPISG